MTFASDALADKVIAVTGASSGLGRATARFLSTLGATLVLIGRDEARLNETWASLNGQGHRWRSVDLKDADITADALQSVAKELGPLHGIFHAAGASLVSPARLTKQSHLTELFGAAVFGAFGVAKAASRRGVMHDAGSLVFMSSVSALRGRRGMVGYSGAKAATSGMVRALAVELAERKIRANSITAGAVATEMHETFVSSVTEEMSRNYKNLHPLGFGRPEDVANAVAFLLSDASQWITGVDFPVDGGYAAK